MSLIEQLRDKVALLPVKSHRIEAWDTTVYWKPLTPHESALIKSMVKEGDPDVYYALQMVVLKALDEDGKRLFENADAKDLRRMPYQAEFIELASRMAARPSVEDAEKN